METFLELNGYQLALSNDAEYELVMQVAQGMMTKEGWVELLEHHVTGDSRV